MDYLALIRADKTLIDSASDATIDGVISQIDHELGDLQNERAAWNIERRRRNEIKRNEQRARRDGQ